MTVETHPAPSAEQIFHHQDDDPVLCTLATNGVATLTLNRPRKHNAFDDRCIADLLRYLTQLRESGDVRMLILTANGQHFSAGADLNWMQSMVNLSQEENEQDAAKLAELLHQLDTFPTPTLALVQGSAFGGAVGMVCCCDIVIAMKESSFCLSEVKLGLIPATIGPYVCRTLGQRQARRFMLTAERFSGYQAQTMGLVHQLVVTAEERDELLAQLTGQILANGPAALQAAKALCKTCELMPLDDELRQHTSQLIAEIRTSSEGQEGLHAFFEKRRPVWSMPHE